MFGLSMRNCTVSSINSHAEAVAFYESCPVKGGHDYGDERPIRGKERSPMSVRITDNIVKFRYHTTDVVSWRPDNTFKIEAWMSNSTCAFADVFTPTGTYMTKTGTVLKHGEAYHPLIGSAVAHPDGRVDQQFANTCFATARTDRRKGREALAKTRYAEYRKWRNVMWPMLEPSGATLRHNGRASVACMDMLQDEEQWHDLMMDYMGQPDNLREFIYTGAGDVFYTEYATTLPADMRDSTLSKWQVVRNDSY